MKTSRLLALAAVLFAGAATPALAGWDHIGTIHLDRNGSAEARRFELGGPVTGLQFRADNDVDCEDVTATFGNGSDRSIFSGRLREDRTKTVSLSNNRRHISRLAFNCEVRHGDGARIEIFANIGESYRSEWRSGAGWQNTWANVFNWGSNEINDWKYIGEESFEGRNDSETAFAGWKGRGSDAIALKPINADARCSQVTATFENGNTQNLAIHNGDYMSKGMFYKLDLPGDRRNVTSLSMRCRATDAHRVTIQIFTSK